MSELIVSHPIPQSKPAPTPKKKKPGQKCTVLEWVRNGYQFPSKPAPGGVR